MGRSPAPDASPLRLALHDTFVPRLAGKLRQTRASLDHPVTAEVQTVFEALYTVHGNYRRRRLVVPIPACLRIEL